MGSHPRRAGSSIQPHIHGVDIGWGYRFVGGLLGVVGVFEGWGVARPRGRSRRIEHGARRPALRREGVFGLAFVFLSLRAVAEVFPTEKTVQARHPNGNGLGKRPR